MKSINILKIVFLSFKRMVKLKNSFIKKQSALSDKSRLSEKQGTENQSRCFDPLFDVQSG